MDIDPSPTSRKRRHLHVSNTNNDQSDNDDDNEQTHRTSTSQTSTPSKRLQNPQGLPITRQTHHLNTHIILQSLAFTRLRVTANFSLYNPHTSPVLICVTRESDSLYRTLWSVCPASNPQLFPACVSLSIYRPIHLSKILKTNILTSPSRPSAQPSPQSTPSLPTCKAFASCPPRKPPQRCGRNSSAQSQS
jgi:hypothetical protein